MSQGVHTGVCAQLSRHGVGKLRVNNCHVRSNLEVGDREPNALSIIGDDRECGYLSSGAGGGGNGAEVSLGAELRQAKDLAHILKRSVGILVLNPHGLSSVDRGATTNSNDPVRLELRHDGCALHDCLYRRIGLNASISLTSKPASLRSASSSCRKPPRRMEPPPVTITALEPLRFFTS
mgnify:CR=1 FL=1